MHIYVCGYMYVIYDTLGEYNGAAGKCYHCYHYYYSAYCHLLSMFMTGGATTGTPPPFQARQTTTCTGGLYIYIYTSLYIYIYIYIYIHKSSGATDTAASGGGKAGEMASLVQCCILGRGSFYALAFPVALRQRIGSVAV